MLLDVSAPIWHVQHTTEMAMGADLAGGCMDNDVGIVSVLRQNKAVVALSHKHQFAALDVFSHHLAQLTELQPPSLGACS